jgi:hypothetical protein
MIPRRCGPAVLVVTKIGDTMERIGLGQIEDLMTADERFP